MAAPSYVAASINHARGGGAFEFSYMASHLERCYESSLERMFDEDLVPCHELVAGEDGKWSIGAKHEAEAVRQLGSRLPSILEAAGSDATSLWGVSLNGRRFRRPCVAPCRLPPRAQVARRRGRGVSTRDVHLAQGQPH